MVLWLLNRALDGLDGAVARAAGKQADFGGYRDTMVDFSLFTMIPIRLALNDPQPSILYAMIYFLGASYINAGVFLYFSAILERRNRGAKPRGELTTIHMPCGIIEGAEAIIFFCLFSLISRLICAGHIRTGYVSLGDRRASPVVSVTKSGFNAG